MNAEEIAHLKFVQAEANRRRRVFNEILRQVKRRNRSE